MPPVTLAELGTVHVGAGVSFGVMPQLRFTVPLNPDTGVSERLKVALCPGLIVCELGDPDVGPMLKSDVPPVPDKGTVCGLPGALSVMLSAPLSVPVVVGVNVTEIWQIPPAAMPCPQVFDSLKLPETEIWLIVSAAPPLLVSVTICGELVVPTV